MGTAPSDLSKFLSSLTEFAFIKVRQRGTTDNKPNNHMETREARRSGWETRKPIKRGGNVTGKGEKRRRQKEMNHIWNHKYKPGGLNATNILIFLQFHPSISMSFFSVRLFSCRWLTALSRQPVLTLPLSQLDLCSLSALCIYGESSLRLLKASLTFWVRQFVCKPLEISQLS